MLKKILFISLALLCLLVNINSADAAKRKKNRQSSNPIIVSADDIYVVRQKVGKRKVRITCYDGAPGSISHTANGMVFKPISKKLAKAKRLGQRSKVQQLQSLLKAGTKACRNPNFLDLDKYTGPFGVEEAQLLYNRFAFGGTPEEINLAVEERLERTVDRIMTRFETPTLDAQQNDLMCDGYLEGDQRQEACDPRNINDLRAEGARYDIYNRILYGPRFYMKLWFFLHDERMAVSSNAAPGSAMYSIPAHVNMLKRAAYYGDYQQLMRDWNNDLLGNLLWLDGASNRSSSPNENYGREFWELGTVGPTGLDGQPVYTDFDITQSALAFSGRQITCNDDVIDSNGDNLYICYGTPQIIGLHNNPYNGAQIQKRVFAGTRYERIVDTDEDLINATFAHPRVAEHLAEDIWKEFINPYATSSSIRELAQVIRNNRYNLLPVLRKVMLSKALFDSRSRGSLIKHPIEMVFGLLRHTGIPILNSYDSTTQLVNYNMFEKIDDMLEDLSQRPLRPQTVFGWNEVKLAGEEYVRSWRTVLIESILNQGDTSLRDRGGFDYYTRFISSFPGQPAAANAHAVVENIARALGYKLSDQDRINLGNYTAYDWSRCESADVTKYGCVRNQYFLRPTAFSDHFSKKIRGLIALMAMLDQYRMK